MTAILIAAAVVLVGIVGLYVHGKRTFRTWWCRDVRKAHVQPIVYYAERSRDGRQTRTYPSRLRAWLAARVGRWGEWSS